MSGMGKDDLLVAVSHSGQNADTLKVLNTANKNGIGTLAITTFLKSEIAESADLVLATKTRESPYRNVAISSRISQFAVMDSLFMAYLTVDYESCIENNNRLTDILKDLDII